MTSANTSALASLKELSARIGADPLLIQGAGGNTSVKDGAAMWIKASGTQLVDALTRDIFVPVRWKEIAAAVDNDPDAADKPQAFQLASGMKPSIETCLHAVLPQPVVLHVHCVDIIAIAMQKNASAQLKARLGGLNWAFIPYFKPGATLAAAVARAATPKTDVFILGNHGLIVAAQGVDEAETLLGRVVDCVRTHPILLSQPMPDAQSLKRVYPNYAPVDADHPLGFLARSQARLDLALGGGLFPDQVLFCGPGLVAIGPREKMPSAAQGQPDPVMVFIRGIGAVLRQNATDTERAMAKSVGDVMLRVPEDADLTYITAPDCAALLNWDAEKYRRALNSP